MSLTMPASIDPGPGGTASSGRLVLCRVSGQVAQAAANDVVTPDGLRLVRAGQGGVVLGVDLGSPAGSWESDHLEPGASVTHADETAYRALQVLACVGNRATVTSGPAAGAIGTVVGKHGAVLVRFAQDQLGRIGPGDWVTIDAIGVGASLKGEPDVAVRSCSPELLEALVRPDGDRLRVEAVAIFPAEAAAAGIGMPSDHLNLDLEVGVPPLDALARELRFGDVVVLQDHDHTYGRLLRPGWIAIGVVAHGRSLGGGHGFGFVTLVTGPAERFDVAVSPEANLRRLLGIAAVR
jgi:uncharacterized protein DUF4438